MQLFNTNQRRSKTMQLFNTNQLFTGQGQQHSAMQHSSTRYYTHKCNSKQPKQHYSMQRCPHKPKCYTYNGTLSNIQGESTTPYQAPHFWLEIKPQSIISHRPVGGILLAACTVRKTPIQTWVHTGHTVVER
jgi:hypothetical protein